MSEEHGPIHIDEAEMEFLTQLMTVVMKAKTQPFTSKSDFARSHATAIAAAASDGLISSKLDMTTYTNHWMVTAEGLDWMDEVNNVLGN